MYKKVLALILLSLVFLTSADTAEAKKIIPRTVAGATTKTTATTSSSRGVTARVRFRADRRAVIATFTNLSVASSVAYTLTYTAGGTTQGAGGSILPGTSEPVIRELLFGTCSHGICRYDSGISNARLVVTTTLKNGKKISKAFRLKV